VNQILIYNKIENIPLVFQFNIENYVPVINANKDYPVKVGKGYIFLYKIIGNYHIYLFIVTYIMCAMIIKFCAII